MHRVRLIVTIAFTLALLFTASTHAQSKNRGILLQDLTWIEAEKLLTPDTVVVIPLGAAAKEHGPHLRLDNDLSLARYYTDRVLKEADVVIAPTIPYHFYPSFVEYPGSTHLRFETARDLVVDIVKSLANYAPRRFYILNTGVSTMRPLRASAELLAKEGILMRFTDILTADADAAEGLLKQERGTHADESETSMMLYMYPDRVNMKLAAKDDSPNKPGGLTRKKDGQGTYSPTGIWGDATLATREKGRLLTEATVKTILKDIADIRTAALPAAN
ncbi:MAG: creatininase family protein [Chloracidobacterium sp.]|nr:creatininase family protein [Chloracidobacterium sp.]